MNIWRLPKSVEIRGRVEKINSDYRDILDILARLNDPNQDEQTRMYVALALFYENFDAINPEEYREAAEKMFSFINCGEEDTGNPQPKTVDWDQDQAIIVADINRVAGCDVRTIPYCHWWTFISWFNGIGDGQLATIVSLREKIRTGKKLSDWERDFYRKNRYRVDFRTMYTESDDAMLDAWIGKKKTSP